MTMINVSTEQRKTVVHALYDYLFETDRYLSSSRVTETPGPNDLCCDYHRGRWEEHRAIQVDLEKRKKGIEQTLRTFGEKV